MVMWLKRRPQGQHGAPPAAMIALPSWLPPVAILLGLLLPLFGASALVLLLTEWVIRKQRSAIIQGPAATEPGFD